MKKTIYSNNDCRITLEYQDRYDVMVNVNDENLIWISGEDKDKFENELRELLDKYRI